MLKAESIIHALGITDQKDLEGLLSYFFDYSDEAESDASDDEMGGGDGGASRALLSLRVKPEQVVRVISTFIKDREEMRQLAGTGVGVASAASAKAEADEKMAARLESRNEEEQNYWRRMVQVVPDKQVGLLLYIECSLSSFPPESRTTLSLLSLSSPRSDPRLGKLGEGDARVQQGFEGTGGTHQRRLQHARTKRQAPRNPPAVPVATHQSGARRAADADDQHVISAMIPRCVLTGTDLR